MGHVNTGNIGDAVDERTERHTGGAPRPVESVDMSAEEAQQRTADLQALAESVMNDAEDGIDEVDGDIVYPDENTEDTYRIPSDAGEDDDDK